LTRFSHATQCAREGVSAIMPHGVRPNKVTLLEKASGRMAAA